MPIITLHILQATIVSLSTLHIMEEEFQSELK